MYLAGGGDTHPLAGLLEVGGQVLDLGGIRPATLVLLVLLVLAELVDEVQRLAQGCHLEDNGTSFFCREESTLRGASKVN